MKIKYFAALIASSMITVSAVAAPGVFSSAQADPVVAGIKACAGNPCAANPCAANPCAGNPCAANPCAANPCAANPCAANPCAANPCAANPCAANPCAANPCASANPCAANPCASANPCAAATKQAQIYSYQGLAIRGADPVAYFTEGMAVKGSTDYEYEWKGATWRFSSAENMAKFAANPDAYAPQYGGYCAKAVSEGNLASVDPTVWRIVNGKLYLNYSADVQQQWVADIPGNIAKGDQNWDGVLNNDVVYESGIAW